LIAAKARNAINTKGLVRIVIVRIGSLMRAYFLPVYILVSFLSCKNVQKENVKITNNLHLLRSDLNELPNSKIDSICIIGDTLHLKMTDSISYTQNKEEGMINQYVLYKAYLVDTSLSNIVLTKTYPNRKHLPRFSFCANKENIVKYTTPFKDTTFCRLAEYIVKRSDSRKGPAILTGLNALWAIEKNGNLEKSWGENFFEILEAFCSESKNNSGHSAYNKLLNIKNKSKEIPELEGVLEVILKSHKNYP